MRDGRGNKVSAGFRSRGGVGADAVEGLLGCGVQVVILVGGCCCGVAWRTLLIILRFSLRKEVVYKRETGRE